MDFVEYKSEKLIDFYAENGLEFNESKGYFGKNVQSFVILENEQIIGAVTISIYKNKNFIEAIAVNKKYRNKGYGKLLLERALKELEKPVYTISKVDKFYLNNGFIYDNSDLIDKECKNCIEYKITCFPKVMIYKEEKL